MDGEIMKEAIFTVVMAGVIGVVIRALNELFWKPKRLRWKLEKQGIRGPPNAVRIGDVLATKKPPANDHQPITHDYHATLLRTFNQWRQEYGSVFTFSLDGTQVLYIYDPEILREVFTTTSYALGKSSQHERFLLPLLGRGVLTSNGPEWFRQRKIIAPELFQDKVKAMINLMVESSNTLVKTWSAEIEKRGGVADINIDSDMRRFSGDVISRACFGSNYDRGEQIFSKLRSLSTTISSRIHSAPFPGTELLPTPKNRLISRLEKEVRSSILQIVKEGRKGEPNDLLHMILEGAEKESGMGRDATDRFIVDNCKNMYLAGYETTATTGSWTLMLLAVYPEWQEKVREEVVRVCGDQLPDAEMIRQMKTLTMVIQEALRLYAPTPLMSREVLEDIDFGKIRVPKGVNMWVPVPTLHHDPELWGPDAHLFNPDRFTNGVAKACKMPYIYMPFSVGARTCLGQHFAMMELKVLISIIISKFSITLSPRYKHSPVVRLIIEPECGVDLILRKL